MLLTESLLAYLRPRLPLDTFVMVRRFKETVYIVASVFIFYRLYRNSLRKLQRSQKMYMRMFRENPQPMWMFSKKDLRFLEVNDAALQLYGYTRGEFLQMSILDIRPPEDVPRIMQNQAEPAGAGHSASGIWRHYKKDGSLIYVRIESFSFLYGDEPAEVISIFDITTAYLAGKALKKQEQLLNTIINSSQTMIWAVDNQLQLLAGNDLFRQKSGLLPGLGEASPYWRELYEKSLQGEKQLVEFARGDSNKRAEWNYAEISFDPIVDEGEITGVTCIARDITDKKNDELALKRALERYDVVTMATNDAIWDFNIVTNRVIWNDNAIHFFGFSNREEEVAFWEQRIHPDDREAIMASIYQAIEEKRNHWRGEYRLRDLKGEYRHVISRGYILYNRKREPKRMIGALQDVEDVVAKTEEVKRLSLVASMTSNPILVTDAEGRIDWVNKSFEDLTGYALEDVKGLQPHSFLHGPDTDPATVQTIIDKLAAAESCVVEIANYNSEGVPYWVIMEITPIMNDAGKIDRHIVIQTNITERKKFVQQLEEQNRLLNDVAFMSSHELRAPVSSLLGIFALLNKEDLSHPDNQPLLTHIERLVLQVDGILHRMAEKCNEAYRLAEQ